MADQEAVSLMSEPKPVYTKYRIVTRKGDVVKAGLLVPFKDMKEGVDYHVPRQISKDLGSVYGIESKLPDLEPGQRLEYS